MLALHHNQHFKGFYNWAIKLTSAREGREGKGNNLSLGTVPPSSHQFSTPEVLVLNKALRSCYASAHRDTHSRRQNTNTIVSAIRNLFLKANPQFIAKFSQEH